MLGKHKDHCQNCDCLLQKDKDRHFFVNVVDVAPVPEDIPNIAGVNFLFCHKCYVQMVGLEIK